MAVTTKPYETTLKIVINKVGDDGKTKAFTRSYGHVKPAAEDAAVYDVADALVGLQTNPLNRVLRVDSTEISETI